MKFKNSIKYNIFPEALLIKLKIEHANTMGELYSTPYHTLSSNLYDNILTNISIPLNQEYMRIRGYQLPRHL